MPRVFSRRALLGLALTPVLLAGCGGGETAPVASPTGAAAPAGVTATPGAAGTPTAAPAPAQPTAGVAPGATPTPAADFAARIDLTNARHGGRLVEGWVNEVRTLNPLFAADVVSGHATALLFNGLVKINPTTLLPEGDLAASWQVAPDSQGYLFRLRPNAVFHDGRPCTAEDVKFTYDLLRKDAVGAPRQADLAAVLESVAVISPTEVEFRLKNVFAPFLAVHGGYGIVPKHLLEGVEPAKIEQSEFSLLRPVGTGPFRFKEWRRGSSLTLTRHDAAFAGQPFLDEVVLRVVPSQEVLQTQLKLGEVDVGIVREADVEEMERQQNLVINRVDSLSITYLGFQLDPARTTLFQDRQVRQALALGLDRAAMVRLGRHGLGRVAGGAVPPPSWAANERLAGRLGYEPARAEALLDTLGWRRGDDGVRQRDGKKLAFELLTNRGSGGNRVREQYALLVQEGWKKLGADVKLTLVDFPEVVNRLRRTHEFDVYLAAFACDADPDQRLLWASDAYRTGFNASRYSNATVDRLLTEAVQTLDQARRRDLYARVQEILLDELPAIILDYPQTAWAVAKRARNVIPNPASLAYNAHQWWVVDGK
jgi:peptide/nickel transport system substrate-binding protein